MAIEERLQLFKDESLSSKKPEEIRASHVATKRVFKEFAKSKSKNEIIEKWVETAVTYQFMVVDLLNRLDKEVVE